MKSHRIHAWLGVAASVGLAVTSGLAHAQAVAPGSRSNLTNNQFLAAGSYIVSDNKQFFAIQQTDGNLCVYKGSGPNDNRGGVWCHMKYGAAGPYFAIQQSDGNLCTYRGTGPNDNKGGMWCHMGRGVPHQGNWVTVVQNDANLCTYPADKVSAGNAIWCTMALATPAPAPTPLPTAASAPAIVAKYAPLLKFDSGSAAYGYPMSADTYYKTVIQGKSVTQMQNTDPNTIKPGNRTPIYYTLRTFGGQVRIRYWIFYGYQAPCINVNGTGSHNGDWEDVTVILKQDQSGIAAVQFGQHGGRYIRISGPRDAPCTTAGGRCDKSGFELYGTHPVAYIGRTAHGTFHDSSSGLAAAPGGSCTYYGDSRDGRGVSVEMWGNPVSLDGNAESWLAADRLQNFPWGPDGVNTHPTMAAFPTASCTGDASQGLDNAGCFKSECLSGDDEAVGNCLKECEPGYTNMGLTCSKLKWGFIPTSTYGRLDSGKHYGYSYGIPQTDAGLARRRNNNEYNLP
jgi:hypothetical protein